MGGSLAGLSQLTGGSTGGGEGGESPESVGLRTLPPLPLSTSPGLRVRVRVGGSRARVRASTLQLDERAQNPAA